MQFGKTWYLVTNRVKNQTRRIAYPGDELDIDRVVSVTRKGGTRKRFAVGDVVSVQPGRGKSGIAKIRITHIRRECVQAITEADATREGFRNRVDFMHTWQAMYANTAHAWEHNPAVWVLTFELCEMSI